MLRSARPCASAHAAGIESVQSLRARVRPSARTGDAVTAAHRWSWLARCAFYLTPGPAACEKHRSRSCPPRTEQARRRYREDELVAGAAMPAALRPVVLGAAVITLADLCWTCLPAPDREAEG